MRDKFFELTIYSNNCEVIKDFLFSLGASCVEEDDGLVILRDESDLSEVEWGVLEFVNQLNSKFDLKIDIKTQISIKENKDWIKIYKESVKPISVGKFHIRPEWCEKKDGLIDIIINPALAFGSGHHESTNSCLNLISKYAKSGTAIDVGCGSGILSIAMAKLGLEVSACDTDEQAILSTTENAKINNVKLKNSWVGSLNLAQDSYDFVVANIIADVIFILKNDLKKSLKSGGYLILSGILEQYHDRILDSFKDLEFVENIKQNEWESFVFKGK